ncbi:hypothetical protein [Acaryochloris marina]|uniref:Uncharacterized protein n=1 Tax=Acaryochloris marina (strain MBIC 11017) TaxID=329726 RepID=A8ZPU9_ACAM1|nr:hypothetical protein [Acaryochloris marina]ABW33029.1 hypothetical protein AM1_F0156 [Acaryochloris marina MBIC11017]BDM83187.1 hypothetical protein AM10699_60480 [Acaryochloris marina MBIC10699]
MSEEKPSQSISISGGQNSNVQIGGIAGGDQTVTQTQQIGTDGTEVQLTQADVVDLITQLEALLKSTELPKEQASKALRHLESAKEEVQAEEPDKDYAAKSLKKATTVLKEAGETVAAGSNLWKKIKPIVEKVTPWLGVASGFLL